MNLVLSEFGMVTSVGHDAATSCAAIRAGMTRATPLADAQVLDPDTQTMIPLIGHAVYGLTDGASPVARWLTLSRYAFLDLYRSGSLPAKDDVSFWERTALALVSPVVDDARFMFFAPFEELSIETAYATPLLRSLAVPIDPAHMFLLSEGRTGAVRAIAGIETLLDRRAIDRVIVLATDSYLDGYSIEWLGQAERLKQADQPSGLMPGEAAAAVLVEREQTVHLRGAKVRARISAAVVDREPEGFLGRERRHGRAIARVLSSALEGNAQSVPFSGDLICDLNGEAWRAYEFGAALAQVPRALLKSHRVVLPAMSIGDVGASSALVGLIVACRAFERGHATSGSSLVTCASGSGRVGAVLMNQH